MKAQDLFLLINEIDEKLIADTEECDVKPIHITPKRRSPFKGIMAFAACAAVLFGGIFVIVRMRGSADPLPPDNTNPSYSNNVVITVSEASDTTTETEPNVSEPEENSMPNPFGSMGELPRDYTEEYVLRFENLTSEILSLAPRDEYTAWLNSYNGKVTASEERIPPLTVLDFVKEFDISEEQLLSIVKEDNDPDWTITSDDVAVIFSDDTELINRRFINKYAVLAGDKIYTPQWFYEHTAAEYAEEGLTNYDVTTMMIKMKRLPFTDEAMKAMEEKYMEFQSSIKETEVIDEDFPEVLQAKFEPNSFEDKLRHIMLRAKTVEELKNNIAEMDTEGRVIDINVYKKTDKFEYYKTGEPVTEGNIEPADMTIYVYYDRKNQFMTYSFGSYLDTTNHPLPIYEFEMEIDKILQMSDTVEELKQLLNAYDVNERIKSIRIYIGGDTPKEITEGKLEIGMHVDIEYDRESYWSGQKNSYWQ